MLREYVIPFFDNMQITTSIDFDEILHYRFTLTDCRYSVTSGAGITIDTAKNETQLRGMCSAILNFNIRRALPESLGQPVASMISKNGKKLYLDKIHEQVKEEHPTIFVHLKKLSFDGKNHG